MLKLWKLQVNRLNLRLQSADVRIQNRSDDTDDDSDEQYCSISVSRFADRFTLSWIVVSLCQGLSFKNWRGCWGSKRTIRLQITLGFFGCHCLLFIVTAIAWRRRLKNFTFAYNRNAVALVLVAWNFSSKNRRKISQLITSAAQSSGLRGQICSIQRLHERPGIERWIFHLPLLNCEKNFVSKYYLLNKQRNSKFLSPPYLHNLFC